MTPAQPLDVWIGAGVLALLGLGAALLLLLGEGAAISRSILLRFARIALPVALLLGLPLLVLSRLADLEDRLWQALIAGLVIALGWLTTTMFAETGRARDKAEKLRDYHKALFAEIRDTLAAFYSEGQGDAQAAQLVARMEADESFVPFIPNEVHDRVYAALLDEIEVLPRQTIDAVVAYYSLIASIRALAEDMRSDRFAQLPQGRRILIYQDYVQMRQRAYQLGSYALALIDGYAKGGAPGAEAVTRRFSSPDAGRNARSPGSESAG
ncbi:hypothetical protein ACFSDD_14960 [Salipiger marinus]|uniref:hypothetical protein n=1 Tax=Salipiger marinus TaxID=555512 RepID=UPI001E491E37|nr:hypothetical protein [Salipiger manganoxidans]MCD1617695.1 hypothetical protein [Salipiger manganoxidans]MEB3418227.1 hypothetical protein [Salipiger manganoxidans]